jgi:tRNA(fMet)-specific endonuclease VapC
MTSPPLYLLDTNIVIHYARGKTVGQQIEADHSLITTPYRPLICIVTHGEALAFAKKRSWGKAKIAAVNHILAQFVTVDINDPQIIEAYADIDAYSQSIGRRMGKNDLWIAAVAHITKAALLTTDDDFDHLDGSYLTLIPIDPDTGKTV